MNSYIKSYRQENIREGRTLSIDKIADDHKHNFECFAEYFAEPLREQKKYNSRTYPLHRKFQHNQRKNATFLKLK